MEKKSKWSIFINTLIDILFIPILVLALLSSALMFTAKRQNEVPSLFGYSSVVILSGSMRPDFNKGDYALVKSVDTNSLAVGDIIAFYAYYKEKVVADDLVASGLDSAQPKENTTNIPTTVLSFLGGGADSLDKQEAIEKGSLVLFHRITYIHEVYEEGEYHRFFVTKGDSNGALDRYAIHDSMVIGKYVSGGQGIANVFKFVGSPNGIVLLVLLPCGILLLLLSQSMIDQIIKLKEEKALNEKKVIEASGVYREAMLDASEQRKANSEDKDKEETKSTENKQKVEEEKPTENKVEESSEKVISKEEGEKPKTDEMAKKESKPTVPKAEIKKDEAKQGEKIAQPKVENQAKKVPPPKTKIQPPKPEENKTDVEAKKVPPKVSEVKEEQKVKSPPKAPQVPQKPATQDKKPSQPVPPKAPPKAPPVPPKKSE